MLVLFSNKEIFNEMSMYFYTGIYMIFIEIVLYRQDFTQEGKQAEDRALLLHEGIRQEPE